MIKEPSTITKTIKWTPYKKATSDRVNIYYFSQWAQQQLSQFNKEGIQL